MNHSMRSVLLRWFLGISLVPLAILGLYVYQKVLDAEIQTQNEKLEMVASLHLGILKERFFHTHQNLNIWAKNPEYEQLLGALEGGWKNSHIALNNYVKTDKFQTLNAVASAKKLTVIKHNYSYVYDLFLIDTKGNILFTVAKESDLGENLFSGVLEQTRFARAVRATLKDQKDHFSDLERYAPSNNALSGFLTTPIRDESGKVVGVMAMQFEIERLMGALSHSSVTSYLVGSDGLLRSSAMDDESEVLTQTINTQQFWRWYNEHGMLDTLQEDMQERAFIYQRVDGVEVIGAHNAFNLLGVRWALISEVDKEVALAQLYAMIKTIGLWLLLVATAVSVLAFLLAKKITAPIETLVDASLRFVRGEKGIRIAIDEQNEIGHLGEMFNQVMGALEENEARLIGLTQAQAHTLQELEEQKKALDAHNIVSITNEYGIIIYANEKFSTISGYSNDELIGQNHRMINSGFHSDEFWKNMYETIGAGLVWHNEVCNRARDGHLYWMDATVFPLMDEQGRPKRYIAIRTDITTRKNVEMQLIETKEKAENSAHAKSDFLATMSHEIRTPMNGILGMLGLLARSDLDASQAHQVAVASSSATALLGLINDILDFSKIEAGKMELEMLECNLHELLRDFYEMMIFKFDEKNIQFVVDKSALECKNVMVDGGRLRQILTNLVGNALKFTHHGEVRLVASLERLDERGLLRLEVHDSGIGVDTKRLESLFDPFTQADSSTTRKYGGTGLGLSIVKKLCELMNGTIDVKSVVGEGSVFSVVLDVVLGDDSNDWNEKTRILLVEDNPTNQMVALGMLDAIGLEADIATNGQEAIEALKLALAILPYTIVLMDCQMPIMDGYEATSAIRAGEAGVENQNIPIVAMTANAMSSDREKCMTVGMDDFLTKPIDLEKLQQILVKWIGQKKQSSSQQSHASSTVTNKPFNDVGVDVQTSHNMLLWDHDGALSRLGGREELLEKIIESFVSDAPIMMTSLEEAIKTHNLEAVQLHAHSLKGSSANIGAVALSEISKLLENAAKKGNIIRIQEKIGECEKILGDTLTVLRQFAAPKIAPVQKLRRLDPIAMMMELQELTQKFDEGLYIDTQNSKLFKPYRDEQFTQMMRELKKYIDQFEYDSAKEVVLRAMEVLE